MRLCPYTEQNNRRKGGFTLIELLVSLMILAIGLVGLSQLCLAGMRIYLKSQYTSIAAQRAQFELEQAESLRFNVLQDSAHLISDTRYPASNGYFELSTLNGVQFDIPDLPHGHGVITVSHYQNKPSILLVNIQISWRGGLQLSGTDTLSTLITK